MKLFAPTDTGPVAWYSSEVHRLLRSQEDPLQVVAMALEFMRRAGQAQARPAFVTLPDLSARMLQSVRLDAAHGNLTLECGEVERHTLTLPRERCENTSIRAEGLIFHARGGPSLRVTFASAGRRKSLTHQRERRDVRRCEKDRESSPAALVFRTLQGWLEAARGDRGSVLARRAQGEEPPARVVKLVPNLQDGTLKLVLLRRGGATDAIELPADALANARLQERRASFHAGLTVPLAVYRKADRTQREPRPRAGDTAD